MTEKKLTKAEMNYLNQCFVDETGFLDDSMFTGTPHQRIGFLSSLKRKGVIEQESADLFYLADDTYEKYTSGGAELRQSLIDFVADSYGFRPELIVPMESDKDPCSYCLFSVYRVTYKVEDGAMSIVTTNC